MQIVVSEYGTKLSKCENRFVISNKDRKEEFSSDNVDQIIIAMPSMLTDGVVKLAAEKNIDVVFTDFAGRPYARIYPCTLGGTTLTRREQARAMTNEKGDTIAKKIITGKIRNQIETLKKLSKTRDNLLNAEIESMKGISKRLDSKQESKPGNARDELMGYEGASAAIYFSALNKIEEFGNRDPKGKDIFNIALNYGYGVFYSQIERSCILAGLDPYLGFIHSDRYGKPSLTLDLIEPFRPIVDKAIITMRVQKRLKQDYLEEVGDAKLLTNEGRNEILKEILTTLTIQHEFKNKELTLKSIMLEQCREISRFLVGQQDTIEIFEVG